MRLYLRLILLIFITVKIYSQQTGFYGKAGFYVLGSADIPLNETLLQKPFTDGYAVRVKWEKLETAPGTFNFSFLDSEIAKAKKYSKNISISVLGVPQWMRDSIGALTYKYIDKNNYHATYGDTLYGYVPWDGKYIERVHNLIKKLGEKYSNEAAVSYINSVAVHFSRNLPDTLYNKELFHELFNYKSDTLVKVMKEALDVYMMSFPNTDLWSSMDYIRFEPSASGEPINYVASEYAKYGIAKYPDRFGVWREDLSACNPQTNISTGSHWYIIKENPGRNGAQMLWSVQDSAKRMNQCGTEPKSKSAVLESAIKKGMDLGMNYFEIYQGDVQDTSLTEMLTRMHGTLFQPVKVNEGVSEIKNYRLHQNYPNPFNPSTVIKYQIPTAGHVVLKVFDVLGREVATLVDEFQKAGVHTVNFRADDNEQSSGIYFYRLETGNFINTKKMLLIR